MLLAVVEVPRELAKKLSMESLIEDMSDYLGFFKVRINFFTWSGVVKKKRLLYLVGQTRVHCDEVEGLGCFMELEVWQHFWIYNVHIIIIN